jgi:hypothetical protein
VLTPVGTKRQFCDQVLSSNTRCNKKGNLGAYSDFPDHDMKSSGIFGFYSDALQCLFAMRYSIIFGL